VSPVSVRSVSALGDPAGIVALSRVCTPVLSLAWISSLTVGDGNYAFKTTSVWVDQSLVTAGTG
jgi:hypothetical protein